MSSWHFLDYSKCIRISEIFNCWFVRLPRSILALLVHPMACRRVVWTVYKIWNKYLGALNNPKFWARFPRSSILIHLTIRSRLLALFWEHNISNFLSLFIFENLKLNCYPVESLWILWEIKNYNILCLTALEIFSRAAEPCSLLPTILLASINVGFWVTVIDRKFPRFWNGMKFPEKVSRQSFTKFHKVSESFKKISKFKNCVLKTSICKNYVIFFKEIW